MKKYSIIDSDVFCWLNENKKKCDGICLKKFHADFVLKDLSKYKVGDEVLIDSILCHITQIGKKCFGTECNLFNKYKKPCKLKMGVAFAN